MGTWTLSGDAVQCASHTLPDVLTGIVSKFARSLTAVSMLSLSIPAVDGAFFLNAMTGGGYVGCSWFVFLRDPSENRRVKWK